MTFLFGGDDEALAGVRQNGEAELCAWRQQRGHACACEACKRTRSGLYRGSGTLATLDATALAASWHGTNRPGPFPGLLVSRHDGGRCIDEPAAASWTMPW